MVPQTRIQRINANLPDEQGQFVLYWMTAFRRPAYNFALDRAIELANQLRKPLVVFESLRVGYRWCSDRFHQFVMEGMSDNEQAFADAGVTYFSYVEKSKGDGSGLLEKLASKSAAVVADDYPGFFLPSLQRRFARTVPCCLEYVDSNGIYPMRSAPKVFSRAHFFRIYLQKNLRDHLLDQPSPNPFENLKVKKEVDLDWLPKKWRQNRPAEIGKFLAKLPIDHSVGPIKLRGGIAEGQQLLKRFVDRKLGEYDERRNYPEEHSTSGLSGHLHFGHIASHQIFAELAKKENWSPRKLADQPTKKAMGWWGMSQNAEAYLDQLITWRELGFNMAWQDRGYTKYQSLPDWVHKTMDEHRGDKRDPCYSLEELEQGRTHDDLWNAAQNQLKEEGIIHNYLRMLWGKKILHWSESPEEALRVMIELNNKYAIDGRDPNSYSGIFWVMGRYDRAWGPVRPIFGKIRYMASENTARKFPVKDYVRRYGNN